MSKRDAAAKAMRFNRLVPVGTEIEYRPSKGSKDSIASKTRSEAFLSASYQPVVFIEAHHGYVAIDHVMVVA